METTVYANKGWQHIGTIPGEGRIYPEGRWCFNVNERSARTCDSQGLGGGKYYIIFINKGDQRYPYSGDHAKVGQLVYRVGENGTPAIMEPYGLFWGGEDVWMTMNDNGFDDNDGYLTLRFEAGEVLRNR